MEAKKLTSKILTNLKPENILYAEFAEGGAMGAASTTRIYVLEKNTLHFYLVDLNGQNSEEDIHAYADAYSLLRNLVNDKKLIYAYGGYGNHAYKNKNSIFSRDDDNCNFIYQKNKDTFIITPSVRGVYFQVASKLAQRPADFKTLTKFRKQIEKNSTPEELAFYDAYLEQTERTDQGLNFFKILPEEYWDAIVYIRSLNLETFNLSQDHIIAGSKALQKYRLKYLVLKTGYRAFDEFIANLIATKNTHLFHEINKYINSLPEAKKDPVFNINHLFTEIKTVSSDYTNLQFFEEKNITELFGYPVIVKFTDAANREIIHQMLKSSPEELLKNSLAESFYLANYIFSEDVLSYADILPVCVHIIEDLPNTDPDRNNPECLFWLATEIIDRIWRYASENKITQKKCRDFIYELFSPRIGNLWPIVHYHEFEFKEHIADVIFRESLSFIMSLNDISNRNDQLANYLSLYQQGFQYPLESVERRAFFEMLKNYDSPKEEFEKILELRAPQEYPNFLSHPDTVKEATLVLDELFRTDDGARIVGLNRIATFEQLLLNGNSIGVGVHIFNYLTKHFDDFSRVITIDCENAKLDPLDVITSLYTAAAAGSTEENELQPLKALTKKITKYAKDLQIEQTMNAGSLRSQDIRTSNIDVDAITEAALRYAKKRRRTILFQRSALQKFF